MNQDNTQNASEDNFEEVSQTSTGKQSEPDRDQESQESWGQRILSWWLRVRIYVEIFLFILVLVVIVFWNRIFIVINSGELGVYYRLFGEGTVLDEEPRGEGLNVIFPWNRIYVYNVREQEFTHTFQVLAREGLHISVEISIRYHPKRDGFHLNYLHKELGPNYLRTVIVPEIQSALRFIIGKYEPQELYQADYGLLDSALSESLLQLTESYVQLVDLLVMKITLPPIVRNAIEEKLREEHNAEKYEYLLMQAQQEAKRKAILAQGIRDFQDIVAEGISQELLRWRGIEATLELARSPNSKIVVIGGADGLPLILNTEASNALGGQVKNATQIPAQIPSATSSYYGSDPGFSPGASPSFYEPTSTILHTNPTQ